MPDDLKKYVVNHLKEAEAYQKYTRAFKAYQDREIRRQSPRFAETEAELDKMEKALKMFPVPEEYRADWQDTDVVRCEREWRQDIEVMRREVELATRELDDLIAKAQQYQTEDSRTKQQALLANIAAMTIGLANWFALRWWGRRVYRDHYGPDDRGNDAPAEPQMARVGV